MAWVNAEDAASVRGGLAVVATALGLDTGTGDAEAAGRAVRRQLETDENTQRNTSSADRSGRCKRRLQHRITPFWYPSGYELDE